MIADGLSGIVRLGVQLGIGPRIGLGAHGQLVRKTPDDRFETRANRPVESRSGEGFVIVGRPAVELVSHGHYAAPAAFRYRLAVEFGLSCSILGCARMIRPRGAPLHRPRS